MVSRFLNSVIQAIKNNVAIIVILLTQFLLASLLCVLYLLFDNSLQKNGNWVSTKLTLEKALMGRTNFMENRQTLATGSLDLGAWHGYQEVLIKNKLENVNKLNFTFFLKRDAYLCLIFNKTDSDYLGIRLSSTDLFDNIFFKATNSGEFREKIPIDLPLFSPNKRYHFKIEFQQESFSIFVDNQKVSDFKTSILTAQTIGFRGSEKSAFIDNIGIYAEDKLLFYESFRNYSRNVPFVLFLSYLLVLSANLLVAGGLWLFAKLKNRKYLSFSIISINFLAIILSLGIYSLGNSYIAIPSFLKQEERDWLKDEIAQIMNEVKSTYSISPEVDENTYRILFIGSSQTWGAGASKNSETFVALTEDLLNDRHHDLKFECINVAVSAINSSIVLDIWKEWNWLDYQPKSVVINLSNNDSDAKLFGNNLVKMIDLCLAKGIKPILVLEPNSIEHYDIASLLENHQVMKAVGENKNVPVIDMHAYLKNNTNVGFLWWDSVHLTSFGHNFFAKQLTNKLIPLLSFD